MTAPNKVWLIGLILCLSAALAWAQLYSGSVVGVISDPSKAVIPGAKVSLVDDEKGFTFNVDADSSGRYLFRNVAPGKYSITVTADGFQAEKRTGIQIDVNQNVTVDFAMQLTTGNQENHLLPKLKKICRKAGIMPRAATLHALRHSFGSHLRMAGVPLASIADLMGHKDVATKWKLSTCAKRFRASRLLFLRARRCHVKVSLPPPLATAGRGNY